MPIAGSPSPTCLNFAYGIVKAKPNTAIRIGLNPSLPRYEIQVQLRDLSRKPWPNSTARRSGRALDCLPQVTSMETVGSTNAGSMPFFVPSVHFET